MPSVKQLADKFDKARDAHGKGYGLVGSKKKKTAKKRKAKRDWPGHHRGHVKAGKLGEKRLKRKHGAKKTHALHARAGRKGGKARASRRDPGKGHKGHRHLTYARAMRLLRGH
jgi:hypothetical protein